jgi:hypothetical protein
MLPPITRAPNTHTQISSGVMVVTSRDGVADVEQSNGKGHQRQTRPDVELGRGHGDRRSDKFPVRSRESPLAISAKPFDNSSRCASFIRGPFYGHPTQFSISAYNPLILLDLKMGH